MSDVLVIVVISAVVSVIVTLTTISFVRYRQMANLSKWVAATQVESFNSLQREMDAIVSKAIAHEDRRIERDY